MAYRIRLKGTGPSDAGATCGPTVSAGHAVDLRICSATDPMTLRCKSNLRHEFQARSARGDDYRLNETAFIFWLAV